MFKIEFQRSIQAISKPSPSGAYKKQHRYDVKGKRPVTKFECYGMSRQILIPHVAAGAYQAKRAVSVSAPAFKVTSI